MTNLLNEIEIATLAAAEKFGFVDCLETLQAYRDEYAAILANRVGLDCAELQYEAGVLFTELEG